MGDGTVEDSCPRVRVLGAPVVWTPGMSILASQTTHDLATMGIPIIEKVARTLLVYLGLVVLLRLAGKRDLAQLNSFDLVVLLLLSNVVQNAVIGNDNSLVGGLLGAVVLVAVNAAVVRLVAANRVLATAVEGRDTELVIEGEVDERSVRRLGLRRSEVVAALRRQGASSLSEVKKATLRPGGAIEVTLRAEDENATKGDLRRLEEKLNALLARP
jgi:uncharacterized membrane protein YcaP (DUF421 family)